jgi:hypothetical protein
MQEPKSVSPENRSRLVDDLLVLFWVKKNSFKRYVFKEEQCYKIVKGRKEQ